jgi:hypothetical protein
MNPPSNISDLEHKARRAIQWAKDSVSGEMITFEGYQRAFIDLGNCNSLELNFLCELVNSFYVQCNEKHWVRIERPNKLKHIQDNLNK